MERDTPYIGHNRVIKLFDNALKKNHLSKVYLFNGLYGVGKETFAQKLAVAITRISHAVNGNFCNTIACSDKISNEFHKGILENIFYLKKTQILVEDTKKLLDFLYKKTEHRKCIIIDAVENATIQASNAMLKIMEENTNVVFLLITSSLGRVLKTIKSRAIKINFSPLLHSEVVQILQFLGYKENKVISDAAFGSVGMAVRIYEAGGNDLLELIIYNILSGKITITKELKENFDLVLYILHGLLWCFIARSDHKIIDFTKISSDKNLLFSVYYKIQNTIKDHTLYSLDIDAVLFNIFSQLQLVIKK